MKKIFMITKRTLVALIALFFLATPYLVMAEDGAIEDLVVSTSNIGPQGPVGPIGSIGPSAEISTVTGTNEESANLENTVTGANSENINTVESNLDAEIATSNDLENINNADIDLNSGQNELTGNTAVSSLTTGDISGSVNLLNVGDAGLSGGTALQTSDLDGNTIDSLYINPTDFGESSTGVINNSNLLNSETGFGSLNANSKDTNTTVAIFDDNYLSNNNGVTIDANTGENNISQNTTVGNIETGDIDLDVNLINIASLLGAGTIVDLSVYNILNGLTGDIVIPDLINFLTGANSSNENIINQNIDAAISENRDITNENVFQATTETGNNDIARNTSVGNVATGDALVSSKTTNMDLGSVPIFYLINVFGKWLGLSEVGSGNYFINQLAETDALNAAGSTADLQNSQTGANSDNFNEVSSNLELDADTQNTVNNKNDIKINANTGKNKIKDNTLVGNVKTGSISVISNVANLVSNLGNKFKKVKLGIINIFGNWNGNLKGEADTNVIIEEDEIPETGDVVLPEEEIITPAEVIAEIPEENIVLANEEISDEPEEVLGEFESQPTAGMGTSYLLLLIPAIIVLGWLITELLRYRAMRRQV